MQDANVAESNVEIHRENQMRQMLKRVANFWQSEDGPTAVEYAVMLALIVVVCLVAITALGSNANKTYTSVGNSVKTGS